MIRRHLKRASAHALMLLLLLAAPTLARADTNPPEWSFRLSGSTRGQVHAGNGWAWDLPIGQTRMVRIDSSCIGIGSSPQNCVGQFEVELAADAATTFVRAIGIGLQCFYFSTQLVCAVNQAPNSQTSVVLSLKVDPQAQPGEGNAAMTNRGNWLPSPPVDIRLERRKLKCRQP